MESASGQASSIHVQPIGDAAEKRGKSAGETWNRRHFLQAVTFDTLSNLTWRHNLKAWNN